MGASQFEKLIVGKDANDAFRKAVDDAYYYHGHNGYTGTICEKDGFVVVQLPEKLSSTRWKEVPSWVWGAEDIDPKWLDRGSEEFKKLPDYKKRDVRAFLKNVPKPYRHWAMECSKLCRDKWGPALFIELRGKGLKDQKEKMGFKGRRVQIFYAMGWASC